LNLKIQATVLLRDSRVQVLGEELGAALPRVVRIVGAIPEWQAFDIERVSGAVVNLYLVRTIIFS